MKDARNTTTKMLSTSWRHLLALNSCHISPNDTGFSGVVVIFSLLPMKQSIKSTKPTRANIQVTVNQALGSIGRADSSLAKLKPIIPMTNGVIHPAIEKPALNATPASALTVAAGLLPVRYSASVMTSGTKAHISEPTSRPTPVITFAICTTVLSSSTSKNLPIVNKMANPTRPMARRV